MQPDVFFVPFFPKGIVSQGYVRSVVAEVFLILSKTRNGSGFRWRRYLYGVDVLVPERVPTHEPDLALSASSASPRSARLH